MPSTINLRLDEPSRATDLPAALETLGLKDAARLWPDALSHATSKRWTATQLVEHLVAHELDERHRRSLERRQRRARIGAFTPVDAFDWSWPTRIDRAKVEHALDLRFFESDDNVIFCGPHGTGKTTFLRAIAHNAVHRGMAVVTFSAQTLFTDLEAIDSPSRLKSAIRRLSNVQLLCVDDLGYLEYNDRAADLFYAVVNARYEAKRPLVISTNLRFKQWGKVFKSAACTGAIIERLIHRCRVITIEGKSWRLREAEQRDTALVEASA